MVSKFTDERGWSFASLFGPWTARRPVSSEASFIRTLAPPFWATQWSQSLAMFEALTTIITRSSIR